MLMLLQFLSVCYLFAAMSQRTGMVWGIFHPHVTSLRLTRSLLNKVMTAWQPLDGLHKMILVLAQLLGESWMLDEVPCSFWLAGSPVELPKSHSSKDMGNQMSKSIRPSWSGPMAFCQQWVQRWFCDPCGCCQDPGGQRLCNMGQTLRCPLLLFPPHEVEKGGSYPFRQASPLQAGITWGL